MKRKSIRPVSKKRDMELRIFRELDAVLRPKTGGVSELDGTRGEWPTHRWPEPHHIEGRRGKRVYDPFNIIYLTRTQHNNPAIINDKERLLAIVRPIRIKQGFKEVQE